MSDRPRPSSQAIPRGLRLGVDVYSTGQAAAILGVAVRTVAKLCDRGELGHYTIACPQSAFAQRRIAREDLLAYAKARGIPLHHAQQRRAVACLCRPDHAEVVSPLRLGVLAAEGLLGRVVIGCGEGYDVAVRVAVELRATDPTVLIAVWLGDDVTAVERNHGAFDRVFPADANGELTEFLNG